MAAAPPPFSPRDARRQARDYERAQRDQARAQRQYWRGYRRSSIAGPIVLVAIGVIALLVETGRLSGYQFWGWYNRWWPVLLIGIGVVLLAEYFWDRNSPYAGRRSAGGIVWLIILIAAFGWVNHYGTYHAPFSWNFGDNNNNDSDDFFSMLGAEHTNDVDMDQAVAASGTVNIQNPRGDVTVTASNDSQMHIRAHQVVHTNSDKDAGRIFGEIKPQVVVSSSGAVVTVPSHEGTRVDLTLEIPEKSYPTVNTTHGDVTITGIANNAEVTTSHGDVKFDSVTGDVQARMDHGDVSAHNITGHAFINGHVDDVTLSEIGGKVVLDGDFFGDTHLEQVRSTVHIHTSRTDLDIPRMTGDLTMDSDDLTVTQMWGPVRIVTRSKNIDLSQITGDLHLENSNGDVHVNAAKPLGNMQIQNRDGDLSLTVGNDAAFTVNASTTEDNDLDTDFPLQTSTSGNRRTVEGTVGNGGVKLELSTAHGNLELKRGVVFTMPPTPPLPPVPPAPKAPAAPIKHLKVPSGEAPPAPVSQ